MFHRETTLVQLAIVAERMGQPELAKNIRSGRTQRDVAAAMLDAINPVLFEFEQGRLIWPGRYMDGDDLAYTNEIAAANAARRG